MSVGEGAAEKNANRLGSAGVQAKMEAERERGASLFTNNKVQAGAKEDEASFLRGLDGWETPRNANSAPRQPCRLYTRHIAPG